MNSIDNKISIYMVHSLQSSVSETFKCHYYKKYRASLYLWSEVYQPWIKWKLLFWWLLNIGKHIITDTHQILHVF